jgi:hypothetical protein
MTIRLNSFSGWGTGIRPTHPACGRDYIEATGRMVAFQSKMITVGGTSLTGHKRLSGMRSLFNESQANICQTSL